MTDMTNTATFNGGLRSRLQNNLVLEIKASAAR